MRTSVLSLLLVAGLLSGCGTTVAGVTLPSFGARAAPPVAVAPAVARPDDAVAIFATTASPGSSGVVQGQRAHLVRSYNAASGRECREVLLGTGVTERTVVACRGPDGAFASSRPLLRGSAR